jgi:RNA polymerase sigma-70 factor (ECF subfamily)
MAQGPLSDQTAKLLREAWFRYLEVVGPNRAELYRYCRRMTRNIWDAEDLLQETLLKGFGSIGRGDFCADRFRVKNSRTYLFRIATNHWIDQVRRRESSPPESSLAQSSAMGGGEDSPAMQLSSEVRDAASLLMSSVPPQEGAAVVLKDVFDFTLEEIAEILSTTVGAIKSALHRGRATLERGGQEKWKAENSPRRYRAPTKELVNRFIAALNARDPRAVVDLLSENTTLDVCGIGGERGKKMIHYSVSFENAKGAPGRAEARYYLGEWIILVWAGPPSNEVLINVERLEEENTCIAHIRSYYFCPEIIAEIAGDIGATRWRSPHDQIQPVDTQTRIIEGAVLPWAEPYGMPSE